MGGSAVGRVGHEEVVKLKVRWKTIKRLSRFVLSFRLPSIPRGERMNEEGDPRKILGLAGLGFD